MPLRGNSPSGNLLVLCSAIGHFRKGQCTISIQGVGASIARPLKIIDFRIFCWKKQTFRLAATDFALAKSADDQWSPLQYLLNTRKNPPEIRRIFSYVGRAALPPPASPVDCPAKHRSTSSRPPRHCEEQSDVAISWYMVVLSDIFVKGNTPNQFVKLELVS